MHLGDDRAGAPGSRILSIQLLRAVAALAVALSHLIYAFANHVGDGLGIDQGQALTERLAHIAVVLFFVVSGFVMVVSSHRLFGTADGTRRFLVHRAVRVLPPYWIATLVMLVALAIEGSIPAWPDIVRSLVLVPHWGEGQAWPLPLLWPGWTLFFELVFYLLFGLGVSRGKRWAIELPALVIGLLTIAGLVWQPQQAGLFMLTRPVMLAFVWGLLLGSIWQRGLRWPGPARGLALVTALMLLFAVPDVPGTGQLGIAYLAWAGLPAFALFLAVAGADRLDRVNGRAARLVDMGGNISFALYLLHVPVAHLWTTLYPGRLFALGPWVFLLGLVAVTLMAAYLFWRCVEYPLTRWLRVRLLGS